MKEIAAILIGSFASMMWDGGVQELAVGLGIMFLALIYFEQSDNQIKE